MILVNGVESEHISLNDRGLQYGDGLFETIEVDAGHPIFIKQHLQRLYAGCIRLNIPAPDLITLTNEVCRVCNTAQQAVLKITITRGQGGRGYRQPETVTPTRIVALYPFPEYPTTYAKEGITARFCSTQLGLNPVLAGLKHLNRLEQIMARAEWNEPSIQEGIMLDLNGHVIEGVMTNLFYIKAGKLYTAALHLSGVAGVIRAIVMQLAADNNITLVEHEFGKKELLAADEAFVCNSIIGIWPIKQLAPVNFAIGAITKQLQHWLAQQREEDKKCLVS